ncbi:MAG: hypothetical protein KAI47_22000 [Deltaproteobacteria bacterium]|nr:hypothetical protein [Deltaproteobacteria bacterium]
MRRHDALAPLLDHGIIDEVVRPLMSGKEAQVYLVIADGEERVAKVYKEAQNRTFKHRVTYTEGRGVRNTRDRRAMAKRSRHGKALDEEGWRSAEVDIIYRLQAAGVRVPEPYNYIDGVLVMELIQDGTGRPAPRLADVPFSRDRGCEIHKQLIGEIVKMLCAGIVHGDLSEFNVLLSENDPVIIDFPQAVEAARNQSARRLLIRDVDNLGRYLCRSRRGRPPRYGQEMWAAYERGDLTPDTQLTGLYQPRSTKKADTEGVLAEIEDAAKEAERRTGDKSPSSRRRQRRRGRGGQRPANASGTPSAGTDTGAQNPKGRQGPEVVIVRHRGRGGATPTEGHGAKGTQPPSDSKRRASPPPSRPETPSASTATTAPAPPATPRRRRRRPRRKPSPS